MSFWYTFGGAALEAGCSNASTGTGSISVSGGLLSLSAGASGLALVDRTSTADFSVNGTVRAIHLPVNGGTGALCAGGRSATSAQRIPVVGRSTSGNVFGGFWRDSDAFATAAFSVAYTPWIRFRRSGTDILYETSSDSTTGVDGTWTNIGSYADGALWSAGNLAGVTDRITGEGNSTHSVSAWGDPSFASVAAAAVIRRRRSVI